MARVEVQDRFAEYGQGFEQAMRRALIRGAQSTLDAARVTVPKGPTGQLEGSLRLSGIHETERRMTIVVYAAAWYGRFLEYGTLGRRRKKLKQPGRRTQAAPAGSGIRPRRFMLRAGRIGARGFARAVEQELGRLR